MVDAYTMTESVKDEITVQAQIIFFHGVVVPAYLFVNVILSGIYEGLTGYCVISKEI